VGVVVGKLEDSVLELVDGALGASVLELVDGTLGASVLEPGTDEEHPYPLQLLEDGPATGLPTDEIGDGEDVGTALAVLEGTTDVTTLKEDLVNSNGQRVVERAEVKVITVVEEAGQLVT
jgi:hypothetical protein